MLPMAFTLINHLDNYARPLKCLNDQGGMEKEYYDVNATNKLKTFTYPIAFKNIPLYINPTSLHSQDSYLVTFPRVLQREVTNTDFKLNHAELHSAAQNVKISYIAIGV